MGDSFSINIGNENACKILKVRKYGGLVVFA